VPTDISHHPKAEHPHERCSSANVPGLPPPPHSSAPQLNLHSCPALQERDHSLSYLTRWVESLCQHQYYFVPLTKILSTLLLRNFFIIEVKFWKLNKVFLPSYWLVKKKRKRKNFNHSSGWQVRKWVLEFDNPGFKS
jgi:hypothetical protein